VFSTVLLIALLIVPVRVQAQPAAGESAPAGSDQVEGTSSSNQVRAALTWVAGGVTGLGLHELGHVGAAQALGAHPRVKRIQAGPIPFFAIAHNAVGRRREYAVSAAGFWVQHATAEWILTRHPDLRSERAPFRKGLLAFHLITSTVYGIAGLAGTGPSERDTRGMAVSLGRSGVPEGAVGALVWAPAVLDAYRYMRPESRWAKWASRGAKIAVVALLATAD